MIGAVDVGDRRVPHVAEQQRADEVERPLVDGARRVVGGHACRLGQADQRADVGAERKVVGDGVADVHGDGGGAVPVEHRPQHAFDFGVPVVPRHRDVAVRGADHGPSQPVGIGVQVPQRGALGAEVAPRPDVVGVAADVGDRAVVHANPQSAHRLAQWAGHRGETGHLSRLGTARVRRCITVQLMDDGVQRFMRALDDDFPAVETLTPGEARAVLVSRRLAVSNLDDVASADDHLIPGPDGDLRVRIYRPHGDNGSCPAVVFCHGGGFVLCDLDSHDSFCRAMSRHTGTVVVSVDYRLAPEHRAPAAAEDAFAAWCWVMSHADALGVDPARVLIAGDSAGGNLAAVTALTCRERGAAMPAGQVLVYPVIEPFFDTESYRKYATGYVNTRDAMKYYWQLYLDDQLPSPEWLVAPARAESHKGLPPAIVVTAAFDVLQSEGVTYVQRLRAANVPVVHRDYPGLFHGFLTIMLFSAGAASRELLWVDMRELLSVAVEALS